MVKVGLIGGSGYTGMECLRLLAGHPGVEVTTVTSRQLAGQRLGEAMPALDGRVGNLGGLVFGAPDPETIAAKAEAVITAVPHKTAQEVIPDLLARGLKVVDLSADFRFNDPQVYGQWYEAHQAPGLLSESVYGLPELHREQIKRARLVGNPGCYVTSIILAAAPLLKNGLIDPDSLIADSKSGVSGAGRGNSLTSQFCEINDGIMAYKVTAHRHTPEIEQELSLVAGREIFISFTPHLTPFSRGILTTLYATRRGEATQADLHSAFSDFYRDDIFVRVKEPGALPHTLDVRGYQFLRFERIPG